MLLSKLRTAVPVIAFTTHEETMRRMAIYWGITSRLISHRDMVLDPGFMFEIEGSLIKEGTAKKGDSIVFVASSPFLGKPNIIRLHRVGG
jgi:pyruvate kinase